MFGDHLVAPRPLYTHHAIDLGDGTVIEFSSKGSRPQIRRVTKRRFTRGRRSLIRRHRGRLRQEQAVHRAVSSIGGGDYHLLHNNCEHFATWCATGRRESMQIERLARLTKGLCVSVAIGVLLGTMKRFP